jgi:hypothetical protein
MGCRDQSIRFRMSAPPLAGSMVAASVLFLSRRSMICLLPSEAALSVSYSRGSRRLAWWVTVRRRQGEDPLDDDESETREVLGGGAIAGGKDDSDAEDAEEAATVAAARRGRRGKARANARALTKLRGGGGKPSKVSARRWLADKAHQRDIAMLLQDEVRPSPCPPFSSAPCSAPCPVPCGLSLPHPRTHDTPFPGQGPGPARRSVTGGAGRRRRRTRPRTSSWRVLTTPSTRSASGTPPSPRLPAGLTGLASVPLRRWARQAGPQPRERASVR